MTSLERRVAAAESRASTRKPSSAPSPAEPLHVMDFVTNSVFLDLSVYPLQALLIKLTNLSPELLTDYDREVLANLSDFTVEHEGDRAAYVGSRGVSPDWEARIQACRAKGLTSFSEIALVGRRGGKGFLAAILVAWRLWGLLLLGDPQERLGISPGKPLHIPVVGSSATQAKRDAFGDIRHLLTSDPCFRPFVGACTAGQVTLLTPAQLAGGSVAGRDEGLLRISAHPTTETSVRGLAAPVLVLDEFAHQVGAGSTADSTAIYTAARPALAQFEAPVVIQTSSPWEKTGKFFDTYSAGLKVDPISGKPTHPEIFFAQLESWTMYEDWAKAASIPMWPGGPTFKPLPRAIITKAALAPQELLDPVSFAVEYRAQWAAAVNAYLPKWRSVFDPYKGARLEQQDHGKLGVTYVAHADPSRSGANFGFAVGHLDVGDDGVPHVVYDVLHVWRPQDYPDHVVNYVEVTDEIYDYATRFPMSDITFDQFNSAGSIDELRQRFDDANLPRTPRVHERTATAPHNWKSAEIFKSATNLGLIHAPWHELAAAELEHLQVVGQKVDHPTTGPIRSKDLADCMIGVAYTLLAERHEALFAQLAGLRLRASLAGPATYQDPGEGLSQFTRSQGARARAARQYNPARGRWRGR